MLLLMLMFIEREKVTWFFFLLEGSLMQKKNRLLCPNTNTSKLLQNNQQTNKKYMLNGCRRHKNGRHYVANLKHTQTVHSSQSTYTQKPTYQISTEMCHFEIFEHQNNLYCVYLYLVMCTRYSVCVQAGSFAGRGKIK